jgi:hypothetical protein
MKDVLWKLLGEIHNAACEAYERKRYGVHENLMRKYEETLKLYYAEKEYK